MGGGGGGIIDTVYLRAVRWVNNYDENIHGENNSTQTSIKMADVYPAGLDNLIPPEKGKYKRIRISGTVDKRINHIKIDIFHFNNSTNKTIWLGGSNICEGVGPGWFGSEIVIERDEIPVSSLPPGDVVFMIIEPLSNSDPKDNYNYGKIPDDIPDGAIMATIHGLKIELVIP
jgi:hypothetical protein